MNENEVLVPNAAMAESGSEQSLIATAILNEANERNLNSR